MARVVDQVALDRELSEAMRRGAAREAAESPVVVMDPPLADFGNIVVGQSDSVVRTIKIRNSGLVQARWLIPTPAEDIAAMPLPSWASVEPMSGWLNPGESCDVHVSAEPVLLPALGEFGALATLKVQKGKDIMLTLTGRLVKPGQAPPPAVHQVPPSSLVVPPTTAAAAQQPAAASQKPPKPTEPLPNLIDF